MTFVSLQLQLLADIRKESWWMEALNIVVRNMEVQGVRTTAPGPLSPIPSLPEQMLHRVMVTVPGKLAH
ncbi:hypothetical protein SK128_023075 [Halocaridina rubra]|uniref:Uncharacterized protein n=1 Tax=Halocaridina rubra TaxID=373956 RepID=A0AAN8X3W1_HALRR